MFNSCKDKRILEFGCGLGNYALELVKSGANAYGIDISEVAIGKANEQASKENLKNVTFRVMNAEELDFPDNYFDKVCGIAILHHLDLNKSYNEIRRVLKPEGKAIFIEPLGHNFLINLYRKLTPHVRTEDEHPFKKKDLILLKKHFNTIEIKYFYFMSISGFLFRNTPVFNPVLTALHKFDKLLFKLGPIKYMAWQVVIELSDPK